MRITIAFDLDGPAASNWSFDSDEGGLSVERGLAAMVALRKIAQVQVREMHDRGLISGDVDGMLRRVDEAGLDEVGLEFDEFDEFDAGG